MSIHFNTGFAAVLLVIGSGCFGGPQEVGADDVSSDEAAIVRQSNERTGFIALTKGEGSGLILATFNEKDTPAHYYAEERINSRCKVKFNVSFDASPVKPAGTIRVLRQDKSLLTTMEPRPTGRYLSTFDASSVWDNGERLSVRVDGSDSVPSFVATTVTPDPIVLTSHSRPTSAADEPYALQRDSELELTWTGGGKAGDVKVLIAEGPAPGSPLEPGARINTVECSFKPRDHKGIVPATALGFLAKGAGYIQVAVQDTKELRRQGWAISIQSQAGNAFVIPSTIQ